MKGEVSRVSQSSARWIETETGGLLITEIDTMMVTERDQPH